MALQTAYPAVAVACYLYHLKIDYLEDRLSRPEVDTLMNSIYPMRKIQLCYINLYYIILIHIVTKTTKLPKVERLPLRGPRSR